MKRIIASIALIGLASQLHAITPTELIQKMQAKMEHRSTHSRAQATHTRHRKAATHPKRTHRKTRAQHRKHATKPTHTRTHRASKKMANKPAIRRSFRTLDEFRRLRKRPAARAHRSTHRASTRRATHLGKKKMARHVGNGWYTDEHGQYDEQYENQCSTGYQAPRPRHRAQHPYRHYRRQWYLTYLYERAEFSDRHGYHYGYFDRRGFVFEGAFYRYDRAYTYQDRLHGKDIFAHRYYRPIRTYASDRFDEFANGAGFYFSWSR